MPFHCFWLRMRQDQLLLVRLLGGLQVPPIRIPLWANSLDKVKTRRSCLLVGLVCLVGATLLFCFGRSLGAYIVARLLQGVTSGIVWIVGKGLGIEGLIVGLALIADTVEEGRIGRAMSIISIQLNLGLALGPMLGGIVYERDGWYGVFALGFALLGLDIVLRLMLIEKHVAARYNPSSYLTADTFVASDGKRKTSATRRSRKLPEVIRLLQYPRMIAGMWLAFAQATIISAFDAVLPLHLNRLFGWTSFQAGTSPFSCLTCIRLELSGHCNSSVLCRSTFGLDVGYIRSEVPCTRRDDSCHSVFTSSPDTGR